MSRRRDPPPLEVFGEFPVLGLRENVRIGGGQSSRNHTSRTECRVYTSVVWPPMYKVREAVHERVFKFVELSILANSSKAGDFRMFMLKSFQDFVIGAAPPAFGPLYFFEPAVAEEPVRDLIPGVGVE